METIGNYQHFCRGGGGGDTGICPQPLPPHTNRAVYRMSENESKPSREQHGGWSEVKRRFDIEFFARTNGITKRQAADLIKKFGDKDYETLVREARWLRE